VDDEWIKKPKRWNINFIKKFMYTLGPVSSLFDIITFFILFAIFAMPERSFQTGWFLESLATQTFVIYIIRTRKIPFVDSFPSKQLLFSTILAVAIGWILPYTFIGGFFSLIPLPPNVLMAIVGIVIVYLVVIEFVKRAFYKRNEI